MTCRSVVLTAALSGVTAIFLSGCSVADPDTSQVVLHYTGGPLSSQQFEYCTKPGVREIGGVSDYNFYYPAGQRTFTFSDRPGSDAPPIRVSTKNQTELIVRGAIAFTLNRDCDPYIDTAGLNWPGGRLQKFHDTIGRQRLAYAGTGGDPQPDGWRDVISLYVGAPAERAMDGAGIGFTWEELYSDVTKKNAWTKEVEELLPWLISEQAGDNLFVVNNIQLDKPDLPEGLRIELENNQAAGLRKQTAGTDQAAAREFPGGLPAYQDYQQQQAINKAITEGRVNPLIIPRGSPVIVGPAR